MNKRCSLFYSTLKVCWLSVINISGCFILISLCACTGIGICVRYMAALRAFSFSCMNCHSCGQESQHLHFLHRWEMKVPLLCEYVFWHWTLLKPQYTHLVEPCSWKLLRSYTCRRGEDWPQAIYPRSCVSIPWCTSGVTWGLLWTLSAVSRVFLSLHTGSLLVHTSLASRKWLMLICCVLTTTLSIPWREREMPLFFLCAVDA